MKIIVIIPTYNEAENLSKLVSALFSLPLEDLNVIVVDDNSPDGTGKVADELAVKFPGHLDVIHRTGKLGFSSAYLDGFRLAFERGAQAIGMMDADFSHDPKVLADMAEAIKTADVALGSRYIPGGSLDDRWPLWRKWLSGFGNIYARTILKLPYRDVTTGFRLWKSETLKGMPLDRIRSNGYIFQVEMAYMAYCLEYRLAEVPIYFAERSWGKSKMSFRIQMEAALRVWQVKWEFRDLLQKGKKARRD